MNKQNLREVLTGERIELRKHSVSMAQTMFDYVQADRDRLDQFLPWVQYINTVEDELNYIKSTHKRWEEGTLFDYGIFDKTTNIYMGNVGVHTIKWNHECAELGYWILGKFEGHGFMSDAVKLLEAELFRVGFHRVEIRCSDINARSANVPIRCGYHLDGMLRENAIEKGKFRNTKVFSKLIGE